MILNRDQLGVVLTSVAHQSGKKLRYDTHFEARNWEISWWTGHTLQRLDFQPGNLKVIVTHCTEHFLIFPRFSHWARSYIPYFPYPKTQYTSIDTVFYPIDEEQIMEIVKTASERVKAEQGV